MANLLSWNPFAGMTGSRSSVMAHDHTPVRIVCLQPSVTVILAAIGELSRIVACTKYCAEVCPELSSRASPLIVADSWIANCAQIIAARPDLIIAAVPYQEKAVSEILKAGVRFLGLAPHTLEDIYSDIGIIAAAVGASDRGKKVVVDMKDKIDIVRRQTSGLARPRVFCEEWGKPLIASQPWVAELVASAGGEFIGVPGSKTTQEEILKENPDVLIFAWCGAGDRVPLEKMIRERGWKELRAAQNGRVYCVNDEFLNTPAPTLMDGLNALAFAIHPESFPHPRGVRCFNLKSMQGEL